MFVVAATAVYGHNIRSALLPIDDNESILIVYLRVDSDSNGHGPFVSVAYYDVQVLRITAAPNQNLSVR